MPRLRRLSGEQIIGILAGFGFRIHAQRGSHVKLRGVTPDGRVQTLTIPRHREMDIGTVQAIYRQASRFIPREQLRVEFYAD